MAKNREIVCIHYLNEHNCELNKKAEFYGHCQTCSCYSPRPGGAPARLNLKRKKTEDARKKDFKNEDFE